MNSSKFCAVSGATALFGGLASRLFAAASTAEDRDRGIFRSRMILTIPSAARRNAKGSLEPVGISPAAKQAVMESSLTARDTAQPVRFLGMGPSSPIGG